MAVDLPPPLTPQPTNPATILTDALPERILAFGRYQLHILGERLLDDRALEQSLVGAETLSDAVRALATAHYRAGWPGTTIHYARVGGQLFLLVLPGQVEAVSGDAGLSSYFRDLEGERLSAAALEPRRALAAIHAQRSGNSPLSSFPACRGASAGALAGPTGCREYRCTAAPAPGDPEMPAGRTAALLPWPASVSTAS
jgi:hypothetical protein